MSSCQLSCQPPHYICPFFMLQNSFLSTSLSSPPTALLLPAGTLLLLPSILLCILLCKSLCSAIHKDILTVHQTSSAPSVKWWKQTFFLSETPKVSYTTAPSRGFVAPISITILTFTLSILRSILPNCPCELRSQPISHLTINTSCLADGNRRSISPNTV